ncbi:hypothetical protein O6P43_033675 [Quillaja saponaria]|uniref:Uncharacterized protein n=1 Tax=Quillaja saponaria TaxID=32244 RepID=A0AAD7P6U0_QUISA|nr:hypothetical protein O6P43_033675 [Quillaja saponaria]
MEVSPVTRPDLATRVTMIALPIMKTKRGLPMMPESLRAQSPEVLTAKGSRVKIQERITRAIQISTIRNVLEIICKILCLRIALAFSALTLSKSNASMEAEIYSISEVQGVD